MKAETIALGLWLGARVIIRASVELSEGIRQVSYLGALLVIKGQNPAGRYAPLLNRSVRHNRTQA